MSSRTYGPDEKAKLERLITDGVQTAYEIEALQEGLKDTIEAVAEEIGVKASLIKKVIKIVHKGSWNDVYSDFDDLETMMATLGKDK